MKKKCEICGRETNRTHKLGGYLLCSKHMHQLHKHGKFLDNNPRTNNDLNDYVVQNDIAIFNLYNQKNEKNGEFIIDLEDIEKVKYKKWRFSHNHVVTGLPAKHTQQDLAHVILEAHPNGLNDFVIDHADGNPLNNRKSNLRICSQTKNTQNKTFMSNNTSGFIGISYRQDRDRYDPEIRVGHIRCHLGYCKTLKEAVYKRFVAENLAFNEFCNEEEHNKKYEFIKDLSDETKEKLFNVVLEKMKKKFPFGNKLY